MDNFNLLYWLQLWVLAFISFSQRRCFRSKYYYYHRRRWWSIVDGGHCTGWPAFRYACQILALWDGSGVLARPWLSEEKGDEPEFRGRRVIALVRPAREFCELFFFLEELDGIAYTEYNRRS